MTPRLGFLGVGWIGLERLKAVVDAGAAWVAAVSDPSPEAVGLARALAPRAEIVPDLAAMLALDLDGVVIATPSALHSTQSIKVLEAGRAVFCQKPLGRSAAEVAALVDAARRADRLLGVDLSYRHTAALARVRALVRSGEIGPVHAADLVFHNAWGPDKEWYHDRSRSGGGAVMDLGVHLVDAALWVLDAPRVVSVRSALWARGRRLDATPLENEDHAVAELGLEGGAVVRLACSWWIPAGQPAEIAADFWGSSGAARFRNVAGSFYDFTADCCRGTRAERLASPPDAWGGRALVAWARGLAQGGAFDREIERQVEVARVLDAIYGAPGGTG